MKRALRCSSEREISCGAQCSLRGFIIHRLKTTSSFLIPVIENLGHPHRIPVKGEEAKKTAPCQR